MAEEIVGVHLKGGAIDRVKLKSGQLLDRKLMVKQMEKGVAFVTRPPPPSTGQQIHLVRRGGREFLSTNPHEEDGDFVEGLPTF